MKKEFTIDGRPVEFNSSNGWLYLYEEQFGHDILPDLMPALEAILITVANATGRAEEGGFLLDIDTETIGEVVATLSGMEITTLINIAWALAKNADDTIPGPRRWVNQFDTFPVDELGPKMLELILNSSVSKKNSSRILEALQTIRENVSKDSALTESPSQQQIEG